MEGVEESICIRNARINSHLIKKPSGDNKLNLITRESLLDALTVLYDECNVDYLKTNDQNVAGFTERFRLPIETLKQIRPNLEDFDVIQLIGRGKWGEVRLVREKLTSDLYALKTVRKRDYLLRTNLSFRIERDIMSLSNSPWLTHLQYAFQDTNSLYFIMDYHPGGDLRELLTRQGGSIPESASTFYLAELVLAVNDLHQLGYVHRDIKPENVLLDRCGHLKLTDFGSSAQLNEKGWVCDELPAGTPEYIAPEVLQSIEKKNKNYGVACDFWSIGVIGYELTVGSKPFSGSTASVIYSKIMSHTNLKFPPEISLTQAYITFLQNLLVEQESRLTFKRILKHILFKNVDFNGLLEQVPPFVPSIHSAEDTNNFSNIPIKKSEPDIENFKTQMKFSGKHLPFIGFSFTEQIQQDEICPKVKNEQVEDLKKEIGQLQRREMQNEDAVKLQQLLEKKLDEKTRKLESIEGLHSKLERELANSIAECTKLKRTLELERKDRIDLEYKALDLIKGAKLKWEASERKKVDSLNEKIEKLEETIEKITKDNTNLTNQLQTEVVQAENKQKVSLDKIQKLNRHSIISLESRLEKVTTDTNQQLQQIQSKLTEETHAKSDLEKQLHLIEQSKEEIQNQLKETENNCLRIQKLLDNSLEQNKQLTKTIKRIEDENLQKQKRIDKLVGEVQRHDLEKVEFEANKTKLREIQAERKELKDQIDKLKTFKRQTINQHQQEIDQKNNNYIKQLNAIEEKVKTIEEERNKVEKELEEARKSDLDNKLKVVKLEELVKRLESGVTKLENDYEKDNVLKEQIERLEQQLIQVHESFALEKQELSRLKTKFWRMEKDLNNAEIDKRIYKRETKEAEELVKKTEEEMEKLRAQIETNQKLHEMALIELSNLNEQLANELDKFKLQHEEINQQLNKQIDLNQIQKNQFNQLNQTISSKETQIGSFYKEIEVLRCEKAELKRKLDSAQTENTQTNEQLREMSKNQRDLENQLKDRQRDLENTQLNLKALREACTLLEHQLDEYEQIQTANQSKQTQMTNAHQDLIAQLEQMKNELQCARKQTNEERSLRHLDETKIKHLNEDVESLQNEMTSYKQQCVELREYSANLSDELTLAEEKMADFDVRLKTAERDVYNLRHENNALKEENSMQLTHFNHVKESNYQLRHQLNECKRSNSTLQQQIEELQSNLSEKINYYKERELKSDATIKQQTKLIDFLQSKVEETKKKKTFTLFGNSKKENQPPNPALINYKELEVMYAKEKTINRELRKELERMRATKPSSLSPRTKIALEELTHSPVTDKDFARQNSQRMRHNIPHRMESKLCTKLSKCAQCGNQLVMGRMINVCSECKLHAHTHCARALSKTCGLPHEYARHYTESMRKDANVPETNVESNGDVIVEGWVKIPVKGKWERLYATLNSTSICVYTQPPNDKNIEPIQKFELKPEDSHGKVVLEPVASEMDLPIAGSDLPFVLKVEVSPNTTCWPPKCLVIMTLSVDDKDKWFKSLREIFHDEELYKGIVLFDTNNLQVNHMIQFNDIYLLATQKGLYAYHNELVQIAGPTHAQHILILPIVNLALIIADVNAYIITCDLQHLLGLAQCAPCSRPTLTFKQLNVKNLKGFHMVFASDLTRKRIVCAATLKQLVLMEYDVIERDFNVLRVLDTAQPTSCGLFTKHSLIVGVDKFFEIDLETFRAEEFLDYSDRHIAHAQNCIPLAIFSMRNEFLICFNEFATFVDEFGRSTRRVDVTWSRLPKSFHYHAPFLYVIQLSSVEVVRIGTEGATDTIKIEFLPVNHVGVNNKGIFIEHKQQIQLIEVGDDESSSQKDETESEFSFTSSMVQSLEGGEEEGSDSVRRVKFPPNV